MMAAGIIQIGIDIRTDCGNLLLLRFLVKPFQEYAHFNKKNTVRIFHKN